MDKSSTSLSSQERLERFYRYSQHEISDLREQIQSLDNKGTINGEQTNAIDHCAARISGFAEAVRDASSYLPAHDQRTYSEAIKALTEELQAVKSTLAPRQRFTFKKKNASAISINDAAELAAQRRLRGPGYPSDSSAASSSFATTPAGWRTPNLENAGTATGVDVSSNEPTPALGPGTGDEESRSGGDGGGASVRKPSFSQSTAIKIANHTNQHIILPSAAAHATTQGTLSNLRGCVIDMSVPTATGRPFAGLVLRDITSCLLVCGRVDGPAHLTGVRNSTVVVAARQFRMHDSADVDVYLLCGSRPIVEDCSGVRFAALPGVLMTEQDKQVVNMFDQVDDFKWLKSEPSPNWSILDPGQRVKDEVWTDVVPGKAGIGHADILKAANVRQE